MQAFDLVGEKKKKKREIIFRHIIFFLTFTPGVLNFLSTHVENLSKLRYIFNYPETKGGHKLLHATRHLKWYQPQMLGMLQRNTFDSEFVKKDSLWDYVRVCFIHR